MLLTLHVALKIILQKARQWSKYVPSLLPRLKKKKKTRKGESQLQIQELEKCTSREASGELETLHYIIYRVKK